MELEEVRFSGWIETAKNGGFQFLDDFRPGAVAALCVPCYDEHGDPYDLVAWEPAQPAVWWRLKRFAEILGEEHLALAKMLPERIKEFMLYETPVQWLAARGVGACILDWSFSPGLWFNGLSGARCSSLRLRKRLDARLRTSVGLK